jgi:hypothetical protein
MNNTINEENIKIPYKFDSKYISEDSIQRIVRLINDKKIIELLIMNTKLPYIFSDNKEPIIFNYDLKEKTSYDTDQEITWLLTCNQIPTPINMTFNLIENTIEKSILIICEMSIIKTELIPDKYKTKIINNFEGITADVINNIIIKLSYDNEDIYHYESRIYNFSREKIKDVIFNLFEILKEKGIFKSITREGKANSEGEIIRIVVKDENKPIIFKMNKIKLNENDVKWTLSYMPLGTNFLDYLLDFKIIKLKQDQSLVAIINIYLGQIEHKLLKDLTKIKMDLFKIIEEELKKRYPG